MTTQPATHLIGFGDVSSWPAYAKSWPPLDILLGYLGFLAAMYLLMRSMRPASERKLTWPKLIAGFYVGIGGLLGALMSILDGWLFGVQTFIVGGGAVLAVLGLLMGLVWLLFEIIGPRLGKIGAFLMTTPVGIPVRWVTKFLNPTGDEDQN